MRARNFGRNGFTLTEVMVVMVLISIITGAIYTFYSIGIRSHQLARRRSEIMASTRFIQKLIEEKIGRRSDGAHSAFMKLGGMASLPGVTSEIMTAPLTGPNPRLYAALGYSGYNSHSNYGVVECTTGVIIDRLAADGYAYKDDFTGSYLFEVTRTEEGQLKGREYRINFDGKPTRILAAGFLGETDSVAFGSIAANDTCELNVRHAGIRDVTEIATTPASLESSSFLAVVDKGKTGSARLFSIFFSFDSRTPPTFTSPSGMSATDAKKYFISPCNLFCDDGFMFFEEDTGGVIVNHSVFAVGPAAPSGALRELRYATSRRDGVSWRCLDDLLVGDMAVLKFTYFDRHGAEIKPGRNEWQWRRGNDIASIVLEIRESEDDKESASRMVFDLWQL